MQWLISKWSSDWLDFFLISFIILRHFCFGLIVLWSFSVLISGQETENQLTFDNFSKNGSHWTNCTIDGVVHYDNECYNWIGKFFSVIGLALFVIIFLLCGCLWYCLCTVCRIVCCSDRPREVIYSTYVYPRPYDQIP